MLGRIGREYVQCEPLVRDQRRPGPAQLGSFDGDSSLVGAVAHDVEIVEVEVRGARRGAGDQHGDAEENPVPSAQAPGPGHRLTPAGAGVDPAPRSVTGWLTAEMPFSRSAGARASRESRSSGSKTPQGRAPPAPLAIRARAKTTVLAAAQR